MTKEEIVRHEASLFAFENLESSSFGYNGHKQFILNVKEELQNFYEPELKMYYLDQIIKNIVHYRQLHLEKCTEEDCDQDKVYEKMQFFIQQEIDELPKILKKSVTDNQNSRTHVFISYSQKDKPYLDDLRRHFKPLENLVSFWDDSKIQAGQRWKEEIEVAIGKAKIAILLLSADFFNSDFINNNELPPLLQAAEKDGATIISIILKPCLFEEYPQLNQFQAMNSPNRPISSLDETSREFMWVETVKQIKSIVNKDSE